MTLIIRPVTPRKPKTEQEIIEEQKQQMSENVEESPKNDTQ